MVRDNKLDGEPMFCEVTSVVRYMTCAAAVLFVTVAVAAQNTGTVERILVPLSVVDSQGAYGSVWETELWCRNNSDHAITIGPLAIADSVMLPHVTQLLRIPVASAESPGVFLFVAPTTGEDLQFDLRLFNRSGMRSSWGTKLPIVRESQFTHATLNLINVPTTSTFRVALRVYGAEDLQNPVQDTLTVRIYPNDSEVLLQTISVPFNRTGPGVSFPYYAQLVGVVDALQSLRDTERIRFELDTVTTKIWAFVTITTNATQEVAVVTPE
jgi:hypothetical protein